MDTLSLANEYNLSDIFLEGFLLPPIVPQVLGRIFPQTPLFFNKKYWYMWVFSNDLHSIYRLTMTDYLWITFHFGNKQKKKKIMAQNSYTQT